MPRGRRRKDDFEQSVIIRLPEDVDADMIAFSKDFANKYLREIDFVGWTPVQEQLFFLVLGGINWREGDNNNVVAIDNQKAVQQLGWNYTNLRSAAAEMRKEFDYMTKHSGLSIQNPRSGKWCTGNLIMTSWGDSLTTYVKLNSDFMPHFESLYETTMLTGRPFLTLMGHDPTDFRSSFASPLFLNLRVQWPRNVDYNVIKYTTKQLKDIFKMSVTDYMKKDPETGELTHFNRSTFETKALVPALEDINRSETMRLYTWPNGKLFEKEKLNGKVHYYVFKYKVFEREEIIMRRQKIYDCYKKEIELPTGDWMDEYDENVIDLSKN